MWLAPHLYLNENQPDKTVRVFQTVAGMLCVHTFLEACDRASNTSKCLRLWQACSSFTTSCNNRLFGLPIRGVLSKSGYRQPLMHHSHGPRHHPILDPVLHHCTLCDFHQTLAYSASCTALVGCSPCLCWCVPSRRHFLISLLS